MANAPKPMGDIAFVGAVFSLRAAIYGKGSAAVLANGVVNGFSVYLMEMRVPPSIPAFIGAKFLFLPSGGLRYGNSAA